MILSLSLSLSLSLFSSLLLSFLKPRFLFIVAVGVLGVLTPLQGYQETPLEVRYGAPEVFVELHGFLSAEYYDFASGGKDGGLPQFDLHYLYLKPEVNLYNLAFLLVDFEIEHLGEMRLDRAYLRFSPLSDKNLFNLIAGARYAPFSREIEFYQAPLRLLVDRPRSAKELAFDEFRAIGVSAKGVVPLGIGELGVLYDGGYFNDPLVTRDPYSEEVEVGLKDFNKEKMVSGRLGVCWSLCKWELSGGFYHSPNTIPAGLPLPRLSSTGWSIFAQGRYGGFLLRGEYLNRAFEQEGGGNLGESGFYLQGFYEWDLSSFSSFHAFRFILQYDRLRQGGSTEQRLAVGGSFFPLPIVQVKAEWQMNRERPTEIPNNGILFALVGEF